MISELDALNWNGNNFRQYRKRGFYIDFEQEQKRIDRLEVIRFITAKGYEVLDIRGTGSFLTKSGKFRYTYEAFVTEPNTTRH